jgi:6-phosphogluconolactonase
MSTPTLVVHRDADVLARAVAARLVTRLVDVQSARRTASLVLTGGGIGIACLTELCGSPARDAVDWSQVEFWWGDERFLPSGDAERNETQARAALLDHVDVDPALVHPMPSSDAAADPETAAEQYAEQLRRAARPEDHGPVPQFDVLMLGMGPDGHTASLFPESPSVYDDRPVVGVRGAPKPPPLRVSLSLASINAAREVWFIVAGADKAAPAALALGGGGPLQVPAAGPRGRQRTLWLLDRPAASRLPGDLATLASA